MRFTNKREPDTNVTSYKRFRTWLSHKHSRESPAVSTPLSTGRRCGPNFELDDVVQRLELDSPSRCHAAAQRGHQASPLGNSTLKLAAPSLVNDYYTHLLDYSCNGILALALDSSVYIWNSETRSLLGRLDPSPEPGRKRRQTVSCVRWSGDGHVLSIGTRRGEVQVQLWDVERRQNVKTLPSHLSVVRALSWKQQLLSSGSTLGHIHHNDPRAPSPLVGTVIQQEGLCSLQWSPGGEWLASGSADGLLHIWDRDVTGSPRPVATMKQPSAVKAMGWCPWKSNVIATGGGWKDGQLRIWDIESATCVGSADTNSQICSLGWAEATRRLVTGHGHPHHNAICWDLEFPLLRPAFHLTGHSRRILHVALNNDAGQLFTAGADQCLHMWDMSFPQSLLS
ncbi:cell division cycle protein 20 homolog B-like [Phycodurus eques]|uniref:cell division cycle protein 20 homolog B-like n=1 Tax=Phycodurus eques TaxID=693459 RepID=UPI002ACEFE10|nr:cell division cycle protein 20 homolog B-like [Phycodurus eques]